MGGKTTSTTTQNAPQLLEEGKPGYSAAQNFYQGILDNPPIYSGKRFVDLTPTQTGAIASGSESLANPVYKSGDEQAVAEAMAQPLFRQFETEVLPGIRDRAQMAGQGIGSTRRGVAEEGAYEDLGRGYASGIAGPLYAERPRQVAAEIARVLGLTQIGGVERTAEQEKLASEQAAFEEPLYRQSAAAEKLLQAAGVGPGGSTMTASESPGALGTVQSIATTAALLKLLA